LTSWDTSSRNTGNDVTTLKMRKDDRWHLVGGNAPARDALLDPHPDACEPYRRRRSMAMLFRWLVSYLLLPFSLILTLLGTGTLLLWLTSRQRTGKILVTIAVLGTLILSLPVTSGLFLKPLARFPPLADLAPAAGARWVVVLGSGYSSVQSIPANGRLDAASLARLVEGIRVYRGLPGSRLVLSGGRQAFDGVPQAEVLADAAGSLGVPRADMMLESTSGDTQDEARLVRDIVHDDRFVLVTSASHMLRSMRLFEKQGMRPIAAPAGFWSDRTGSLPSSQNLVKADQADHEYVGMLWSLLRGTM
jgi:uncharacterized SAM-binding protein YcdF (DUF218 family)